MEQVRAEGKNDFHLPRLARERGDRSPLEYVLSASWHPLLTTCL
jgi:hypothetical protein